MTTETYIIGIIAGGTAILSSGITAFVTYFVTKRQIKTDYQKSVSSMIQKRKIDVLNDLFSSIVDCQSTINYYGNQPDSLKKEDLSVKISKKIEHFIEQKQKSEIWLSNDLIEELNKIMGCFRKLQNILFVKISSHNYIQVFRSDEWEELATTKERIRMIIYREPEFRMYIKSLNQNL